MRVYLPTYGLCGYCWTSGPAYKRCSECGYYLENIRSFNMVTTFSILKQLPKSWASTMKLQKQIANQKWLRTTGMRFDMQFLRMRIESEHKHIQYAQEK
jgi:hypothetical protein